MPALCIKRLRCSQSRRPAKANLPPIGKTDFVGAPVSPLAGVRAAGVAELPHLSRAIHDYFVDLLLHPMLLAAEKAHGRRKLQSAVVRTWA